MIEWVNSKAAGFEFWYVKNDYPWYLRRDTSDQKWLLKSYHNERGKPVEFDDLDAAKVQLLVKLATL